MHETSIIQNLIELIHDQVTDEEPVRVTAVRLRVGALSGVVPEALRFAFDAAVPGTFLGGARLDIEEACVSGWCAACRRQQSVPSPYPFRCPVCAGLIEAMDGGSELELLALEVVDL